LRGGGALVRRRLVVDLTRVTAGLCSIKPAQTGMLRSEWPCCYQAIRPTLRSGRHSGDVSTSVSEL